jgi:hypothetical protein
VRQAELQPDDRCVPRVPQGTRRASARTRQTLTQAQGWLPRAELTTTMNIYIHQLDDGRGAAGVGD